MPEPAEEIKKLNDNTPRKTQAEELKGKWLEENPKSKPEDYNAFKFKPEWSSWQDAVSNQLQNADTRWELEKKELPDLTKIDQAIRTQSSFANPKESSIYQRLMEQFEDDQISAMPRAPWELPSDAIPHWLDLLKATRQGVQRHATDLASVVANNRTIATDEVTRATGNDAPAIKAWEDSALYKNLEEIEKKLEQWDSLLATDAFPTRDALEQAADECREQFFQFYREHVPVYSQDATVPFIKYQLLGVMKSLSEKVAAQFAARAGEPSFSGMYDLICDVPNRGSYQEGKDTAETLTKAYADRASSKAWTQELGFRNKALGNVDQGVASRLQDEFAKLAKQKPPVNLQVSLDKWSKAYKNLQPDDLITLTEMRQAIGEIAFGIRTYKETVDAVLQPASANSTPMQAVRQSYQKLFDGFVMQRQQEILLCKTVLSSVIG